MIKFYYNISAPSLMVAFALEELAISYEAIPVDVRKQQHLEPDYLEINPLARIPTLVIEKIGDGTVPFTDATAILLHLSERSTLLMPPVQQAYFRAQTLSWLMYVNSALGPLSEQAGHFRFAAPKQNNAQGQSTESDRYAEQRFNDMAFKGWKQVEQRLGHQKFIAGQQFTVADIALWSWAKDLSYWLGLGPTVWEGFPQTKRWLETLQQRPAFAMVEHLKNKNNFKVARRARFPEALKGAPISA
jgi:GSH-dependent disulfide-bond oxidoreductase